MSGGDRGTSRATREGFLEQRPVTRSQVLYLSGGRGSCPDVKPGTPIKFSRWPVRVKRAETWPRSLSPL